MEARYIVDENGQRVSIILPMEEYERLMEELEELEDIRLYDEAKAALERGEDEVIPLDQAMREIREGKVNRRLMAYSVGVQRRAQKQIARLPATTQDRTENALQALADDPRPRNGRELSGSVDTE
jgi:hypothetical protein